MRGEYVIYMKSEGKIKQKLKQVRFRHLKKRIDVSLKKVPRNCVHNERHVVLNSDNPEPVGLCMYNSETPEQWGGVICDDEIDGCIKQAQDCPFFVASKSKGAITEEFQTLIDGEVGPLASEYPDVAALQWMLKEEYPFELSWWQKLRLFFKGKPRA